MTERKIAGVDLARLADWMDGRGLASGPLGAVEPITGGTQNVMVRFDRGGSSFVLRRPPVHKRKNSDETMRREARVLSALSDSKVPHPRLVAACDDLEVIGAAFYLMQPVDGFNPTTGMPPLHEGSDEIRREMGLAMADAIAGLGEVDFRAVGLGDFGKPDAFLERQVARWRSQLESYASFDRYPGHDIPEFEEVAQWLSENRPDGDRPGILHGDPHPANVMFRFDGPELAALVDWELCTIGDPLLDLGWLLATSASQEGRPSVLPMWPGFPSRDEILERYRRGSTRELAHIDWYEALACYKLGIILEGTRARACAGKAPQQTADLLRIGTLRLFERAAQIVAGEA